MRSLLLSFLLAASLSAQTVTVNVPNLPAANVNMPFPSGVMRYQQWFSALSLQNVIPEPMRFQQVAFMAGAQGTPPTHQIDCELWIGHGKFSGLLGTFDNNWDSPPLMAKARALVTLASVAPGQVAITLPFTNLFTWDRVHPVVIEIRVFGNSNGNNPFNYEFRGTTTPGATTRLHAGGSASAPTGAVSAAGMIARFTARPGVVLPIGNGCPGAGNFTPQASAAPIAEPGAVQLHQLTNAASQATAFWALSMARANPPFDLTAVLGLPVSNCFVQLDPTASLVLLPFTTIGGGPGGGVASFPFQLPALGGLTGVSFFTQWIVFDPGTLSGLAVSQGTWSIVAPVGG